MFFPKSVFLRLLLLPVICGTLCHSQGKAYVYNFSALLQGKMKSIYDHIGMKAMESTVKSALDPTPKHECHVSKNAHKVTSVLAYRAYELTQVVEAK